MLIYTNKYMYIYSSEVVGVLLLLLFLHLLLSDLDSKIGDSGSSLRRPPPWRWPSGKS